MKVVPVNDHVLVEKIKNTQTKSGIVLPEKNDEQIHKCKVIAVDPSEGAVAEVGETVIIDKYAGKTLAVDGKAYTLVQHKDILARLKD